MKKIFEKYSVAFYTFFFLSITTLPLHFYALQLGAPVDFALSNSSAEWANFGTFAGGVLGPIFALAAFFALVLTVRLQLEQIKQFKSALRIEELQRMLAAISNSIDDAMGLTPISTPPGVVASRLTVGLFVRGEGHNAVGFAKYPHLVQPNRLARIELTKRCVGADFADIGVLAEHLALCADKFIKSGGDEFIYDYYRQKHRSTACALHALGFILDGTNSVVFFDPVAYRDVLVPNEAALNRD